MKKYIDELSAGEEITIESSDEDGKRINLTTKIAAINSEADRAMLSELKKKYSHLHYVVADPVREEGFLINFESKKVKKNVVLVIDGQPYAWRSVNVMNMRLNDYGSIHVLISNEKLRKYNRRKHFRVFLNVAGTIVRNGETDSFPVTIKDLSESGIGIITMPLKGIDKGSVVEVSFHDDNTGTYFKLPSLVVRVDDLDGGRKIIGCSIMVHTEAISRFINYKQQEQMKRSMMPATEMLKEKKAQEENKEE